MATTGSRTCLLSVLFSPHRVQAYSKDLLDPNLLIPTQGFRRMKEKNLPSTITPKSTLNLHAIRDRRRLTKYLIIASSPYGTLTQHIAAMEPNLSQPRCCLSTFGQELHRFSFKYHDSAKTIIGIMGRLPHIYTAFHPAAHPATLKSRRNATARLAAVGPSATAQPSAPATFVHALADFRDLTGGQRWIIAVPNGVFVDAIDHGGKRNDKRGVELDLSPDLGSRDRLGGCIGFLATSSQLLITPLLSLLPLLDPAAPSMVFCVSTHSEVGT
ncbi:hypothetical protein BU17DRAFT_70617 [Hysterangium stoloniferum]|nr:hypothetical protein BU17DRAFT_70617 [Hysterangium stoloniferum]